MVIFHNSKENYSYNIYNKIINAYSDGGMDTSIDVSEGKLMNEMILTPTQPATHSICETDWIYAFHENHGRNIELEKRTIAKRVASYNQGSCIYEINYLVLIFAPIFYTTKLITSRTQ